MHQRDLGVFLVMLFLAPVVGSTTVGVQADEPAWRSVGLDPAEWTDRPTVNESRPQMMSSYTGNAVISMNVSYQAGWTSAREEGTVIIELFEQWAPITTNNMIAHVESGLYDGVFFHRVINDFVTQAGDPTCKTIGVYPNTSPSCGSGGTGAARAVGLFRAVPLHLARDFGGRQRLPLPALRQARAGAA